MHKTTPTGPLSTLSMLLAFCLLLPALSVIRVEANLLANGGFETAPTGAGEPVSGWQLSPELKQQAVSLAAAPGRRQAKCLSVQSLRETDAPGVLSQSVPVERQASYALSLWAKRDGVAPGVTANVVLWNSGKRVAEYGRELQGQEWRLFTLAFDSGAASHAEIRLVLPNRAATPVTLGRTVWLDEVQLVRLSSGDNLTLKAAAAVDKLGCKLVEQADRPGVTCLKTTSSLGGRFAFTLPEPKPGPYYLWVLAQCPATNAFTLKIPGGPKWGFASHAPAGARRWFRPILPELYLTAESQRLEFITEGEGLQVEQVVLTRDPRWAPPEAIPTGDDRSAPSPPMPAKLGTVELSVSSEEAAAPWSERPWLTTQCVPFPPGELRDDRRVRVRSLAGPALPGETRAVSHWADGSIRWLAVTCPAPAEGRCRLEYGSEVPPATPGAGVHATATATAVIVDTGKLAARFPKDCSSAFDGVWIDVNADAVYTAEEQRAGRGWLQFGGSQLAFAPGAQVAVTEQGTLRVVVTIRGRVHAETGYQADCTLRFAAFAGADSLRVDCTLRNATPSPTAHALSFALETVGEQALTEVLWDAQDKTRSAALAGETARLQLRPTRARGLDWELSLGNEVWQRGGDGAAMLRAFGPTVELGAAIRGPEYEPRTFTVAAHRLEIGLAQTPGAGSQAHEFLLSFGAASAPLRCYLATPLLVASPKWYCASGATGSQPAAFRENHRPHYEHAVVQMLTETAAHSGRRAAEGLMLQFFRTGQRKWLHAAQEQLHAARRTDTPVDPGGAALLSRLLNATELELLVTEQADALLGTDKALSPADLECLLWAQWVTDSGRYLDPVRREVTAWSLRRDELAAEQPADLAARLRVLRRYQSATNDGESSRLYLQLLDGFLRWRGRPGDRAGGEALRLPGMLLANCHAGAELALYDELAHAYRLTDNRDYVELAAADYRWQLLFGTRHPALLWGAADLVAVMDELDLAGPLLARGVPYVTMEGVETPTPATEAGKPSLLFCVVEKNDGDFTLSLLKGCAAPYATNYHCTAELLDPSGQTIGRQRSGTEGLRELKFAVPRDGQTGVYTVRVTMDYLWRWTTAAPSFDLAPGDHTLHLATLGQLLCLDQFILTPDLAHFPWISRSPPPGTLLFEAENAAAPAGYSILDNPAASERLYAKRTGATHGRSLDYSFRVPESHGQDEPRRYRFFARIWKPGEDSLQVSVDDGAPVAVAQVHELGPATYPLWAIATTLGDEAIVRYWETASTTSPSRYTSRFLKSAKH